MVRAFLHAEPDVYARDRMSARRTALDAANAADCPCSRSAHGICSAATLPVPVVGGHVQRQEHGGGAAGGAAGAAAAGRPGRGRQPPHPGGAQPPAGPVRRAVEAYASLPVLFHGLQASTCMRTCIDEHRLQSTAMQLRHTSFLWCVPGHLGQSDCCSDAAERCLARTRT